MCFHLKYLNSIFSTFRNGPYLFSWLYIETYRNSSGTLNNTTIPIIVFAKHSGILKLSQQPAKERGGNFIFEYQCYAINRTADTVVVYLNIFLPSPDSNKHNRRFTISNLETVRYLDSARNTRSLQP